VGEKLTTSGYFGSGQTWTLPDAYNITLDVYPPNRWRADRASSAATSHALQLGATDLEYEVTRVKSPVIGRDMNPMGRGDGTYYCNGGNTAGGSIAITGAKPVFLGESASGYGNNVNNQCGAGGIPGGGLAGEPPEIPIHPWDERDVMGTYTQIKRYPQSDNEEIIYRKKIARLCRHQSNWVHHYAGGLQHEFCMDTCFEYPPVMRNALRFAIELQKLCRTPQGTYDCHVSVHHLPWTYKEAASDDSRYLWGVVVVFHCGERDQSPLVSCACGKARWGLSPKEFKECLDELMEGHGPSCQGRAKDGGGDGDGDRCITREECVEACHDGCHASCPWRGKEGPLREQECMWMCDGWCSDNSATSHQEAWQEGWDWCD